MKTSTPQSGGRQKPLSPGGEYLSPATRPQPVSAAGTPTLQNFTSNDDERERKQRRRSRVIDLQLSNADSPASTISPAQRSELSSLVLPKLSNNQISDHYSTCIKLSQENRITTKNAFGLHLIDYMSDILKEKGSELTNFKVAAGTLDASAKIYAVRVDAVHADVYRVLGGLGKESQGPEQAEAQEAGDSSTEPQNPKRKKRQHSVDTIEQNLNNITRSAIDRVDQIDPLFQKAAASFDECSTVGVFLTALRCSSYHSELHFDDYVIPLSTIQEEPALTPSSVDTTELKALLDQCVEKRSLCPSLAKFRSMQLYSDVKEENVLSLTDKYKESDHAFDINAEIEDDGPEPAGPETDDFDADLCDGNEAEDLGEFAERREAFRSGKKGSQITQIADADIGTMCLQLSSCPGEYSYFSPRTMSMWAGPEHWRFRPRQKVETVGDKPKIKKAKKVFELNFEDDINFETHFCKTRAATTLAKSTLETQKKKTTTLPADFHYDPDNIARMSLRPVDRIKRMAPGNSVSEQEDEIGEYDYNNPNDTSNFCPALQLADSDDDDGPFAGAECTEFPLQNGMDEKRLGFDGEHTLIAEPQKVNKIEINYAKTAKKMDMKHLKMTMWGLLANTSEKADEPNHMPEDAAIKEERSFSSITHELHKRLPTSMSQNLSVPLAFACLLHLANEKTLKLQEVEDLSDVLIMQGD
ncbi:condensin complex subunit 2 [Rana temporaria]|uniref:condensin complex subunit 2 n=1 Tax=Rana temporaria TaxID=8407 RepID=UPI001AACBA63|nr:condensin complex subunit 2 [Rana temporaria]XP_040201871.1 condensin complex subunit 2 [Rana temporaria]